MDFNSVSIILGVEGWRLLAKPAKVFLVPMEPWGLQSCRSPYPKGEGKLSAPSSPKGVTCGSSESFSGESLEPPWHLGCHCHHPSSLLLGHRPDAACGEKQDQTPPDCARDVVQSWVWKS